MATIKKINIQHFGIFQDFKWDDHVKDQIGQALTLKDINIIYGRNYSGKTTLSRIFQILEYKELPDSISNPEFELITSEEDVITNSNFSSFQTPVRVFNEDFVRKHLGFIVDPDKDIEPFAILGENVKLQEEINDLEKKLGAREPEPTGLYKELIEKENIKKDKESAYNIAKEELEDQLRKKATDRTIGIKYHADKFGDLNYNISKLKNEIEYVLSNKDSIISEEEKQKLEDLIYQKPKEKLNSLSAVHIRFEHLKNKTKELVEKQVVKTEKIEQLVKDAVLNKWVQEGKKLHEEKQLKLCAFCGNPISDDRWSELERHFDEESKKLEKEIDDTINEIEESIEKIKNGFIVDKDLFYSEFHKDVENLNDEYKAVSANIIKELEKLKIQLEKRKFDIIHEKEFQDVIDYTDKLREVFSKFEELVKNVNNFTENLEQKQREAKEKLRFKEVFDYINTINYEEKKSQIEQLENESEKAKIEYEKVERQINDTLAEIENKKSQLKNEGLAAKKINEYLHNHFGYQYLSLRPIEISDEITKDKQIKFKVFRGDSIAYNLSEGEKTLVAFCYFMAKLDDIKTSDAKPIIWIDDPISSLDQNHVYFIFSLIQVSIVNKQRFKQLFITTHNIHFLKYLKRLGSESNKIYLLIERLSKYSIIKKMPQYLEKYVTEFIYLFHQLYICADKQINDSNYHAFYNFGNNARKFLEIYLFYKYPDTSTDIQKMKKFFGDDIAAHLLNRLNNEFSHLKGSLERGEQPVEAIAEIKKVAKLILDTIKIKDKEQYEALLNSIN
jgi:wobble nucleotide-excising tRNase